jgi:hypothetical protein
MFQIRALSIVSSSGTRLTIEFRCVLHREPGLWWPRSFLAPTGMKMAPGEVSGSHFAW